MSTLSIALTGLVIVLALQTLVWAVSVRVHDASLVDRVWGLLFLAYAIAYARRGDGAPSREWLMIALVAIWSVRLSAHITWRNRGHGEDPRYAAMRARDPDRFALRSLVTVFWLQGLLAWVVALPLLAVATRAEPDALGWLDVAAVIVWAVGVFFEAVGDWQLARFLRDPANRGQVMDRGLWRYTRHPNYFGDSLVWVAFFLLAAATGAWWSLVGTAAMILLIVRVSGVALTDRRMASASRKRAGYDAYVAATNAFIPGPRRRSRA